MLVQEYAEGGDLYGHVSACGGTLPEHVAVPVVLLPLLRAMHYLHSRGIVHRDIKLENLLFVDAESTKVRPALPNAWQNSSLLQNLCHSACVQILFISKMRNRHTDTSTLRNRMLCI